MLEELKKDAMQRMQKCVSTFKDQLKKLRDRWKPMPGWHLIIVVEEVERRFLVFL